MWKHAVSLVGDDLNTSLGITCVYDVLKEDTNDATKLAIIADFDKVLSLDLIRKAEEMNSAPTVSSDEDAEIEALIAERTAARKIYRRKLRRSHRGSKCG